MPSTLAVVSNCAFTALVTAVEIIATCSSASPRPMGFFACAAGAGASAGASAGSALAAGMGITVSSGMPRGVGVGRND